MQLGDQIGLIATHLLHIGQQLEGLVKIGNVLAGAARVRVVVCVLCCVFRCMGVVSCINVLSWAQNAKRDKVLGSLARVKADTIGSSDESSDEDCDMSGDEDGTKKKSKAKKSKAKKGKGKSKGLAAEIEADAKAKAAKEAKEKKDKQKEKGGKEQKEKSGKDPKD